MKTSAQIRRRLDMLKKNIVDPQSGAEVVGQIISLEWVLKRKKDRKHPEEN
jgi:hypothetical protein